MNEKLKIYGENGENQSQMNSCQFATRATSEFFSGLSLMLVGSGLKRSMLFAGLFHISKRRKAALQLHKTETLKPGKKNAHVILFTHGRA